MPDIPPGAQLVQFGQGLQQIGAAIGGVANRLNQPVGTADVIKAAEFAQTTKVQRMADDVINRFNAALETNPDPDTYADEWQKVRQEIEAEANKQITLPGARAEWDKAWTAKLDKQQETVLGAARERWIAKTEANQQQYLDQQVGVGDVQGVSDFIDKSVAAGVISGDEAAAQKAKAIPQAKYNRAFSFLESLNNPDAAVARLLASGAAEDMDLTPEQVKSMTTDFQFRAKAAKDLQASITEEQGQKAYEDFLTKMSTEGGFKSYNEAASYVNLVDKGHRETVRQQVDRLRLGVENADAYAQDQTRDNLNSRVWDWASTAPADAKEPFTEEELTALTQGEKPQLRAEQVAEIKKTMEAARLARDDKEVGSLYSRMYSALDENKNPALVVSIKDIDATLQDPAKHQAALAKRNELQKDYESRIGTTREETELEAYRTVYSATMSTEAKKKWIDSHVGAGLSVEDAAKWRGKVDPFNDNEGRKAAMGAIIDAYQISMSNPNMSTADVKKLQLELYKAQQQMESIFLANPENTAAWDEQVSRILQNKAVNDIQTLVMQYTGEAVTKYASGEYRAPYKEATAIEYLREQGKAPAGSLTEEVTQKAQALERDTLDKAGMPNVKNFTTAMKNGELIYSDKKIERDASGKIIPTASLYMVKYQIRDGTYVPTVYRMNMKTYTFSDVVWEWK